MNEKGEWKMSCSLPYAGGRPTRGGAGERAKKLGERILKKKGGKRRGGKRSMGVQKNGRERMQGKGFSKTADGWAGEGRGRAHKIKGRRRRNKRAVVEGG